MPRKMLVSKIIPTQEQCKTIEKYGLIYDDIQMGPNDGEIVVKDTWKLGQEDRWYIIGRTGEFHITHKAPAIQF